MPKYKEFIINDLFEKVKTQTLKIKAGDIKGKHDNEYCLPALTAGVINQGLAYYVPYKGASVIQNAISVSANGANSGVMYYQPHNFTVLQDSYAIKFKGFEPNAQQYLYLVTALQKTIRGNYSWTNKAGWERIKYQKILLPITSAGEIDFDYMGSYIRELELARIRELEVYLKASGLSDYNLSADDLSFLDYVKRGGAETKPFMIGDLFYKLDLKFKKDKFDKTMDVSKARNAEFNLPLVNAKHGDNGIMYFGRETDFDCAEMTIDIVGDGAISTGDVYPQPQSTGVLYNAYLISPLWNSPNRKHLLYFSSVIHKSIKHKFGYDNKAGWNKVKEYFISLPVASDGKPDYEYMENYISIKEKLAIKDVVEWMQKELESYHVVITN